MQLKQTEIESKEKSIKNIIDVTKYNMRTAAKNKQFIMKAIRMWVRVYVRSIRRMRWLRLFGFH
jgi:hypothetical protein